MKNTLSLSLLGTAAIMLAGCGGSDSGTAVAPTLPAAPTFTELTTDALAMQSQYTDANGNLLAGATPAASVDIPMSGGAVYNGYVGGDLAGDGFVGELTVEAAFASNSVTSTATSFQHEVDGAYTGTLTGSGPLVRTPPAGVPQVSTSLDGTLSNGGTDFATSIALEGDLLANGTDPIGAVAGTADGTVGTDFLIGVFSAER